MKNNSFIKHLGLERNLWLKIAAVVLAIIMWFLVITRGHATISLEVPVNFKTTSAGLTVSKNAQHSVTVTASGHERFMRNLSPSEIRINPVIEGLDKGTHMIRINLSDIDLPTPLKVVSVTPSTLSVTIEGMIRKTVPVKAVIVGAPAKGYVARSVEVLPGEVTVQGIRSVVRPLKHINTEPVDITAASETLVEEVALNPGSDVQSISKQTVSVKVIIAKE